MPELALQKGRVDRYVRDQLSPKEIAAFETELLESPTLQQELEAVLALHTLLDTELAAESGKGIADQPAQVLETKADWNRLALAATVILAVLSTVMWWKTGNDASDLGRQLEIVSLPQTNVLTVVVPIMRSASSRTPDVIVQKPVGEAAIILDIELGLQAREQEQLNFELVDPGGKTLLSWQSSPAEDGRATVLIDNRQIPASRLWLRINASNGNTLERRLLEFRAP